MYMSYGWPQVVPLLPVPSPGPSPQIVHLRAAAGRRPPPRRWPLPCRDLELLPGCSPHPSTSRPRLDPWSFFFSGLVLIRCGVLVQHKVRLGKYIRDSESLENEGENLQAIWSPDTKLPAVIVGFVLFGERWRRSKTLTPMVSLPRLCRRPQSLSFDVISVMVQVPSESDRLRSSFSPILFADVMLWRRPYAGVSALLGAFLIWILFEQAGYSFLS